MLPLRDLVFVAKTLPCLLVMIVLTGCGDRIDRDLTDGISDPYEGNNRKVHAFNRNVDRAIVRPASQGYTTILPDKIEDTVSNFATNLGTPSVMVNSLLQGDLRGAGISLTRFVVNTTVGLGGIIDASSELGIAQHDTDFGETLYVWGAAEGPYVELPLIGPSTTRGAYGRFVDLFTNPLSYVVDSPESYYGTGASVASGLSTRGRFTDTIDSILYDSADSYAQARLIYMQNRRFELGDTEQETEIDPFALDTEGF